MTGSRPGPRVRMLVLPSLVLALAGCREWPEQPSLLLITVDTLRADHVGCYGGPPGLTPHLDRLAGDGVRIAEAYAAAPITAPAHASLLTGKLPLRHGVRSNGLYRLADEEETLAEWLAARGYRTAAYVGAIPLDHRFGFGQGFAVFDDDCSRSVLRGSDPAPWYQVPLLARERRADEVVLPALAWLEANAGAPFFLWVHLFDPHSPYLPPPGFDRLAGTARDRDPRDTENRSLDGLWKDPQPWHAWLAGITDADHVRGLYRGEVAFTDAQIGRLLAALDRLGVAKRTVTIVTADHGEGLGEHGEYFFHGDLLYENDLRIPMILRAPWRLDAGRKARVRARGVDLFPTALELLGIAPPDGLDGTSLVPALDSGKEEARPVLAEAAFRDKSGRGAYAYIEGALKVVTADRADGRAPALDCYDLALDPRELVSRCTDRERFDPLVERLAALRHRLSLPANAGPAAGAEVPPDVLDALRSLGYQGE